MGPAGPDRTKSADFAGDPRGPSGLMSGRVWSGRASLVEFSYHKQIVLFQEGYRKIYDIY